MKFGLSDDQLRQVQAILSKYPAITEAVVFGSRAMGNYKEASDVDIALKGNITVSMVADVKYALDEDTYLPFFFDVIAYGIIDAPKLKEHIDKYGEVLYRTEWRDCKLGEVAEITSSKRIYYSEYVANGVPFFRSKEIIERFNRQDTLVELFIKRERYEEIKRKFGAPQEGDMLLTSVGTLGVPYLVKNQDEFYFKDGNLTWFRNIDSKVIDKCFLYFWITSAVGQQKLHEASIGSTQPALTIVGLKNIDIFLPPLAEQHAISAVLSSLDAKINLLHRQNKTLEGMASALWRKMFVEEAAATWKAGKLGDYGDFKNGINYSRNENGDTEYSILNVRDIVEFKYLTGNSLEKINVNKSKASPYLLQTNDIVIVRSASPGESLIVLGEIDNLLYSGFSIRLRCHNKQHALFVFQFLQSYKKEMDSFSDGTTLKNINQGILNGIDLVVPGDRFILEFNAKVVPIYNKIMLNQRQAHSLTHLRDALLPKLISGEVRVGV